MKLDFTEYHSLIFLKLSQNHSFFFFFLKKKMMMMYQASLGLRRRLRHICEETVMPSINQIKPNERRNRTNRVSVISNSLLPKHGHFPIHFFFNFNTYCCGPEVVVWVNLSQSPSQKKNSKFFYTSLSPYTAAVFTGHHLEGKALWSEALSAVMEWWIPHSKWFNWGMFWILGALEFELRGDQRMIFMVMMMMRVTIMMMMMTMPAHWAGLNSNRWQEAPGAEMEYRLPMVTPHLYNNANTKTMMMMHCNSYFVMVMMILWGQGMVSL